MLSTFRDLSLRTRLSKAIVNIYGGLLGVIFSLSYDEYNLKQYPSVVLPALPALCLADDALIRFSVIVYILF